MSNKDCKEEESLFVKCECTTHLFEIQRFKYEDRDEGFYVSLWSPQEWRTRLTWKERLRWCWNLIKNGTLWADNIILTNEKAKEVVDYVNKHLVK
jgi:hypothetical protein